MVLTESFQQLYSRVLSNTFDNYRILLMQWFCLLIPQTVVFSIRQNNFKIERGEVMKRKLRKLKNML